MGDHPKVSPLVRPALLAVVAFAVFGVALVAGIIDVVLPGTGLRFGNVVTHVMTMVPEPMVNLFGLMFSVYAMGKSAERGTAAFTSAKYRPAAQDGGTDEPTS